MGISEQIGDFYAGIEDKFYAGMDFLSDHGVPVYAAIDPLEDRGIPAFPILIASTFIVLFLLYGLVFLSSSEINMTLSIKDQEGRSISGVSLSLLDSNGKKVPLSSNLFNDGQTITVPRGKGTRLTLEAKKTGYENFNRSLFLSNEEMDVSIRMDQIIVQLEGAIRLIDIETNDVITGAKIVARISDSAGFECFEEAKGIYSCPGVIQGRDTTLTIDHPNYEQKIIDTSFESEAENEIQMLPKASASSGKSNLIVRIFDSVTKERIGNFTLKIYDAIDNELITELTETDGDGELIEKISKGTSVRIVIEKENYLTYDTSVLGENITLRKDEEILKKYLKPGTNSLSVGVLDVTGRPLISIDVTLFNQFGEVIGSKTTGLAGEVAFENLSTDLLYFVSAWDSKSIPAVKEVLLTETNRVNLVLERATANNSGTLTVYTTNEDSETLNDVTLNFFEDNEELGLIPLGIPAQKTDLTGKYDLLAPLNKDVLVRGTKDNLEGEDSVKILDTFQNEVFIVLVAPFSQVNLAILDDSGNEVSTGFLTVIAGQDILFEGEYESGGITFNPRGNNYVQVTFTDEEGNVIEEEIYVEGLENISVNPQGKTRAGTNPELEFQGIFNIDGTEAQGLAKGIDYFLKFRVNYSEGTNSNGIHVRLGDDSIKFVDSQDAGIIGFSAAGATAFYGRTYTSVPQPGFEALDFSNRGEEGSFNKFAELYFTSGGEKIVKIRVKAKETAVTGEIPLHFRAWTEIGNMNYRTPDDPDLGLEEYSSVKTGLYADTIAESLKILETSASCDNNLCASYSFIRGDGSEFSVDNFQAVLGEIYALEVNLAPNTSTNVTLKASTVKKKPKIGFQGFTINDFTNFPDVNSTDTSLQVDNVSALDGESTTVRLYFKPYKTENSSITLQLISGETVINEQFYFEIYEEKNLTLKTIPPNVVLGEDFVILVEEANRAPIENAEIRLSNERGEHLETISGNGSAGRGGNGRYSVQNSFDAGILLYEVRAPRFRPLRGSIDVTKEGAIEWAEDEVFVRIRKDQVNNERIVELINNSKQNIGEVSFDV
ncbi:hypothetical protein IIC68_01160, partial [archaeon]|nr:hypothetical protein [archaeon]